MAMAVARRQLHHAETIPRRIQSPSVSVSMATTIAEIDVGRQVVNVIRYRHDDFPLWLSLASRLASAWVRSVEDPARTNAIRVNITLTIGRLTLSGKEMVPRRGLEPPRPYDR